MTQEDKQLLMMDLCARLPYKTKVHKHWMYQETDGSVKEKESDGVLEINDFYAIWENKPYLRPMSSMTEEEKIELCVLSYVPDEMKTMEEKMNVVRTNADNAACWLNAHHFDYRSLIERGLALEAPEGMYKI